MTKFWPNPQVKDAWICCPRPPPPPHKGKFFYTGITVRLGPNFCIADTWS